METVLLKERRILIDSGTAANTIKINIRTQSLYIENKLHGTAASGSFIRSTDHDSTTESDSECEGEQPTPRSPLQQPNVKPTPTPTTRASMTTLRPIRAGLWNA